MTKKLESVSVTEVLQFRDCRRRWYLSHVEKLESKVPSTELWFGTGIHTALEAYYAAHASQERVTEMMDMWHEWFHLQLPKLAEEWGIMWGNAEPQYQELYLLGETMLKNYAEFAATAEEYPVVSVEERTHVMLSNGVRLTAKMDLVTRSQFGTIITDHKTASRIPSLEKTLDLDNQLSGYAWIWWKQHDDVPYMLVHNFLLKRAPEEPKRLQSGILSADTRQHTTLAKYQSAGGRHPRVIEALMAKGWSDYFVRQGTSRNEEQLRSFERHLLATITDMQTTLNDPETFAYPNPSQQRCPRCPMLALCMTMEEGGDVDGVVESMYRKRTTRY